MQTFLAPATILVLFFVSCTKHGFEMSISRCPAAANLLRGYSFLRGYSCSGGARNIHSIHRLATSGETAAPPLDRAKRPRPLATILRGQRVQRRCMSLFTKIIKGDIPSCKVGDGDGWYAFLGKH